MFVESVVIKDQRSFHLPRLGYSPTLKEEINIININHSKSQESTSLGGMRTPQRFEFIMI